MNTIKSLLKLAVKTDSCPTELVECSPVFLAVLGFLTGVNVTHPVIIDIMVTSDGMILARHEGDLGFDHSLGIFRIDLVKNLNGLCDALDVPSAERTELLTNIPQSES